MNNETKARGFLKAMRDRNLLHPLLKQEYSEEYAQIEKVLVQLLEHIHYVAIRDFEMMNDFDRQLPEGREDVDCEAQRLDVLERRPSL